ncbi:hypothetical protein LFML04_0018 [Leptospirillum ferriphilum ML-04]|uniref:Uncharacterized protein n=1 Tax=Leptospirillum ferriphilum (strain ML-04) TaxID=1048260 RepID=J9Z9E2_LEPFM|nr:hypothetical protein LFML04_0018 [Leptospirillum ferriphilum ML-04]
MSALVPPCLRIVCFGNACSRKRQWPFSMSGQMKMYSNIGIQPVYIFLKAATPKISPNMFGYQRIILDCAGLKTKKSQHLRWLH